MANNVFVKIPKKGDIAVKDFETKTAHYINQSSFVKAELNTELYEIVGVVAWTDGKDVLVAYKENASNQYCNRAWWYLSGYTLDGAQHTGVISARFASNSWAANLGKTITYSASDMEGLVAALNEAFLADADFVAQDWYADIFDDKVRIHCNNIDYRQCSSNTAKSGFTLTGSLPEIIANVDIRRINGAKDGEGVISSFKRALAYFRDSNTSTTYQPTTAVTSVKRAYPLTLPYYLSDLGSFLRSVYGEGEDGWIKFMKSCLPVLPTDYGNMGMRDGRERTKVLASFEFVSNKVTTPTPMCKAAAYCYNKQSATVEKGEFWLPTTEELARIIQDVEYGTSSSRNSDPLNKGLNLIGGNAVSNGSYWWSCLRYGTNSAWSANGILGFFGSNSMYFSHGCLPVSLYHIA